MHEGDQNLRNTSQVHAINAKPKTVSNSSRAFFSPVFPTDVFNLNFQIPFKELLGSGFQNPFCISTPQSNLFGWGRHVSQMHQTPCLGTFHSPACMLPSFPAAVHCGIANTLEMVLLLTLELAQQQASSR